MWVRALYAQKWGYAYLKANDRLPARFLSMSAVSFVSRLMMRPEGVV